MSFFDNLWRTEAGRFQFDIIDPAKTPAQQPALTVLPDKHYISIYLKTMRIVYKRVGFNTFYAAVNSFIALQSMTGELAQFNSVTTPSALKNLDPKNLEKIINVNKPLLVGIPYRGGQLDLNIGLLSMKAADLTEPFIGLLSNLSEKSGTAFISAALPFAGPIKDGFNLLLGGNDSKIEVGISTTFPSIQTGYYIAICAQKSEIDLQQVVVEKDFSLSYKGKEITEFPYFVFEISASLKKETWFSIPELSAAYTQLQDMLRKDKQSELDTALPEFERLVLTSADLIYEDAEVIADSVKARIKAITGKKAIMNAASSGNELPDLKELSVNFRT